MGRRGASPALYEFPDVDPARFEGVNPRRRRTARIVEGHLERRETKGGQARYRVRYRLGGRESTHRYAGSFGAKR
jgi:hypothetical protein